MPVALSPICRDVWDNPALQVMPNICELQPVLSDREVFPNVMYSSTTGGFPKVDLQVKRRTTVEAECGSIFPGFDRKTPPPSQAETLCIMSYFGLQDYLLYSTGHGT